MTGQSDAQLVSLTLAGNRDAFSQIVARYQALICSIAYSAMGNLGQSEDIAQETFIAAWRHLRHLRDPEKLRFWLCGIVRNRARKSLRREGREPASQAAPLDVVEESASGEALPSEQAITREEEAILWRSLEQIPEIYREPLILFYREHQSVANVASALGLTEDTVKQRLSRGRRLLHEEVIEFVEGALQRSVPGQAFSGAVLAALPAGPASVVAVGAGAAGAKPGIMAFLSPLIGVFSGAFAHYLIARFAPTPRERWLKTKFFSMLWAFVIGWCVVGQLTMRALSHRYQWSRHTDFLMMAAFWWFYAAVIATGTIVAFRRFLAARREAQQAVPVPVMPPMGRRIAVIIGVYPGYFYWLIYTAWHARDRMGAAVLTLAMIALGAKHFVMMRGKTGEEILRLVIVQLLLAGAVTLIMLNWRLDIWFAGVSMETVHVLTLALIAWIGLMLAITRSGNDVATA
jgi:RNA polymerase sigma factor (sigma-70 family)